MVYCFNRSGRVAMSAAALDGAPPLVVLGMGDAAATARHGTVPPSAGQPAVSLTCAGWLLRSARPSASSPYSWIREIDSGEKIYVEDVPERWVPVSVRATNYLI